MCMTKRTRPFKAHLNFLDVNSTKIQLSSFRYWFSRLSLVDENAID